jgi:hypothetical protein
MFRRFLHRFRSLFRKGGLEREMERELRFHLEMEAEKNIRRGMNEEEARLAAQRSFGGIEQTKEAYSGGLKTSGRTCVTAREC